MQQSIPTRIDADSQPECRGRAGPAAIARCARGRSRWLCAALACRCLAAGDGCRQRADRSRRRAGRRRGTAASAPKTDRTKTGIEMVLIPGGRVPHGRRPGRGRREAGRTRSSSARSTSTPREVTQATYRASDGPEPGEVPGRRPARGAGQLARRHASTATCGRSARGSSRATIRRRKRAISRPTATGCRPRPNGNTPAGRAAATRWSFGDDAGRAGQARLAQDECRQDHAPGQAEAAQRLGPVRHARQRGRVVQRFLRRNYDGRRPAKDPARPGRGRGAGAARRQLEHRRRGLPLRRPAKARRPALPTSASATRPTASAACAGPSRRRVRRGDEVR